MDEKGKERQRSFGERAAEWFEVGDRGIYIGVGAAFLVVAVTVFIYSWVIFFETLEKGLMRAILALIHDLLLVLIIMEVMRTVVSYLKMRAVLLEPFLHIGIIASIRRILTSGTQIVALDVADERVLRLYFWDVGINALVIVALAFSLYLFGKRSSKEPLTF